MDHRHSSTSPEESRRFPVTTLLVALVVFAAAAAILVFNVPFTTVLVYGFLGLMLFSHLFMHGGHGAHSGHGQAAPRSQQSGGHPHSHADPGVSQIREHSHADGTVQQADAEASSEKDRDSHQGHSGCC